MAIWPKTLLYKPRFAVIGRNIRKCYNITTSTHNMTIGLYKKSNNNLPVATGTILDFANNKTLDATNTKSYHS